MMVGLGVGKIGGRVGSTEYDGVGVAVGFFAFPLPLPLLLPRVGDGVALLVREGASATGLLVWPGNAPSTVLTA
jgi:hypothetical protein